MRLPGQAPQRLRAQTTCLCVILSENRMPLFGITHPGHAHHERPWTLKVHARHVREHTGSGGSSVLARRKPTALFRLSSVFPVARSRPEIPRIVVPGAAAQKAKRTREPFRVRGAMSETRHGGHASKFGEYAIRCAPQKKSAAFGGLSTKKRNKKDKNEKNQGVSVLARRKPTA